MVLLHILEGTEGCRVAVFACFLHNKCSFLFLRFSADITKASNPEGLLAYAQYEIWPENKKVPSAKTQMTL